jgi:hypothetical protein
MKNASLRAKASIERLDADKAGTSSMPEMLPLEISSFL